MTGFVENGLSVSHLPTSRIAQIVLKLLLKCDSFILGVIHIDLKLMTFVRDRISSNKFEYVSLPNSNAHPIWHFAFKFVWWRFWSWNVNGQRWLQRFVHSNPMTDHDSKKSGKYDEEESRIDYKLIPNWWGISEFVETIEELEEQNARFWTSYQSNLIGEVFRWWINNLSFAFNHKCSVKNKIGNEGCHTVILSSIIGLIANAEYNIDSSIVYNDIATILQQYHHGMLHKYWGIFDHPDQHLPLMTNDDDW